MTKKAWWIAAASATAVVVAGVAGVGVACQQRYAALEHGPAVQVVAPQPLLEPAQPTGEVDVAALRARLEQLAADPALATFGAKVTEVGSGQVLLDAASTTPLRPASSTKVLTASAALVELGAQDRIVTQVVEGELPGTVVIKAAGDVWMTKEAIVELAEQIKSAHPEVTGVFIDTSVWSGETILQGWNPADVDAGFVAPLEPAMINGARLGGEVDGDVPRSHTPAHDVAAALAEQLGVTTVGQATAPQGAAVVAKVASPSLSERIAAMMVHSDNVMAEAIGREVAVHRGVTADAAGATQSTLEVLAQAGFDLEGVTLQDNSGLSVDNRIPPALLEALVRSAATDTQLRALLPTLPVAGGSGTLEQRYGQLDGRGWVRAKTGTLDNTSALAGTVVSRSGRLYSFGMISNGSQITAARGALDALASALHDA